MPRYIKWCSKARECKKCDWFFIPYTRDSEWHKTNCEYMSGMKERITACRKGELRGRKEQMQKWLEE